MTPFLAELLQLKESADQSALLHEIKQNCATQCPIYRGTNAAGPIMKQPVRQDRVPLNSDPVFTVLFNKGIEMKYGIKNIRARSAFATSYIKEASAYNNNVFCIFPQKNAQIVYNRAISDSADIIALIEQSLEEAGLIKAAYWHVSNNKNTHDTDGFIKQFVRHMTPKQKQVFASWMENQLPEILTGYEMSTGSSMPADVGLDVEFMIVTDFLYGIHAKTAIEEVAGEDPSADAYQCAVSILNGAK